MYLCIYIGTPFTLVGNSSFFKRSGPIKFYNRGEPYYEFTNFYEVVVVIDKRHWPTTEHYFQAQKFVGTPILETIRMLSRPREAFDMSRDPRYSRWRRPDWEQVKEDVMYKALQAKFSQHNDLRKLLLDTGERKLIEHSPHDSYWGDGGDGSGKNKLGELLMKLRGEMKAGNSKKKEIRPSSSPHSLPKHSGTYDKQRIDFGNSSTDSSSKPADQAYSSQAQGGSSGGAGPHGQPTKPYSPSPGHGHTWTEEHGHTHQPKEPADGRTNPHTDAMVISNMAAVAQPPSTTPPSHDVTFTPSSYSGVAVGPSTVTVTSPNQNQMPHAQALVTPAPHVPPNQPAPTQGPVAQAYYAAGPTPAMQWSTNQPLSTGTMSSGMMTMTATSQHLPQNSPVGAGHVGSYLTSQGTTGFQQAQPGLTQGPVVQASGAMGPSHATYLNTNQPWSTMVMSSGSTAMSQQPLQRRPLGSGPVGSNPAPLGTPGSQFPQNQQQQLFTTRGSVPQPSVAMGPAHTTQWNTSPHAPNAAMSSMTTMSQQPQQHASMGMGPVVSNPAPPPGFTHPSGGTQFPPTTNQFSSFPSHPEQRGMYNTPYGAYPPYPPSTAHTVAGGGSVKSSFQSGMQAQQQATPQQPQHNYPGSNGHDEPMDTNTDYM